MATIRAGAPINGQDSAYVKANGTDNSQTAPRIIVFPSPVRPCIVTNHCTNAAIKVKVNTELDGTVSNDFDNDADDDGLGHFIIPPPAGTAENADASWVDVSCGGIISVHSVSIITQHASDDLDAVSVVGLAN